MSAPICTERRERERERERESGGKKGYGRQSRSEDVYLIFSIMHNIEHAYAKQMLLRIEVHFVCESDWHADGQGQQVMQSTAIPNCPAAPLRGCKVSASRSFAPRPSSG